MNIPEYENYHETKSHADALFPCNIYPCCIPVDFSSVPLHWHDEMELISVKKGCGIIRVDMEPVKVHAGELAVILPGQLHGIERVPGQRMEYENIIFQVSMLMAEQADVCNIDYFAPFLQEKSLWSGVITARSPGYEEFWECICQIDQVCQEKAPAWQLAVKSCLYRFFYLYFRYLGIIHERKQDKSREKLKLILKYLENHYQEKITISQMAGLCYYSESHFMKFFRNHMGMAFTAYLNSYRLTMAARLLLTTDCPVSEIAADTGFDNISYFNRLFRKKYGTTPVQYRKGQENESSNPENAQ
ncbi:MAG: AraC family transcriptional regulator [Candidatus Limivivens sp.]|nr:AraC family transcriptional regulator [Candidatus Limivivens sp.]